MIAYCISSLFSLALSIFGVLAIYTGNMDFINPKKMWKRWRSSDLSLIDSEAGKIEVLLAEYGQKDTFMNVTDIVRQYINDDTLEFKVCNDIFSDPIPSVHKKLNLTVRINGKEKSILTTKELGSRLSRQDSPLQRLW
ncbi:MAG: hypothetical protein GY869_12900 [Planctomycetes bacterium]|nr:hypothetical protein [Planctomycetota bacterium]